MKIIFDNIIYSNLTQGGISNYWFELSKYLLQKSEDIYFYEKDKKSNNFHRNQLDIPQNKIIFDPSSINSSIIERLSSVKIKEEDFLFHSSYYRPVSGSKNVSEVTTVHDFTHDFYAPIHKKITHNFIKYNAIKRSKGIICISNNTYKDLKKFCPLTNNQKVEVINNGVSNDFFIVQTNEFELNFNFSIEKNSYILFVGSRVNYKNFDFVTALLQNNTNLKLVVVGNNFSGSEIKLLGDAINRVNLVSNVSNTDLNILYNNALAFIYPSSYEGFGIPIVESMKAGCPVIALNASSIPEVAGSAGVLLNKLDLSITNNVLKNLLKNDYRSELIEKGIIQAKKFSWEKCCKETFDFYKEVF